jgi:hypothetical protein
MAQTGAAIRLLDQFSIPFDIRDGVAVPVEQSVLLAGVRDPTGNIARVMRGDALGRPDILLGSWFGSGAPTVGQKPMAESIPVTMASNQSPIAVYVGPPGGANKAIAFGKILAPGAAANIKFALRRTTYNEQLVGAQRSIVSTNANDTAGGTGARKVRITYFDPALLAMAIDDVPLNGLTPVNTGAFDICFIEKMEVIEVGSAGRNLGTITLKTGVGGAGTDIGSIAFSTSGSNNLNGIDNQTYWAHHYVAVGKTVEIVAFDAGTQGNQNAETFLSFINPLVATSPDRQISDSITVGLNSATTPRSVPNTITVVGPGRITMYIIPAGNNTAFYGSFDFWET